MFKTFAEIKGIGITYLTIHLIYRHMLYGQQYIRCIHAALCDILHYGKAGISFEDTADIVLGISDLFGNIGKVQPGVGIGGLNHFNDGFGNIGFLGVRGGYF